MPTNFIGTIDCNGNVIDQNGKIIFQNGQVIGVPMCEDNKHDEIKIKVCRNGYIVETNNKNPKYYEDKLYVFESFGSLSSLIMRNVYNNTQAPSFHE